MLPPIPMPALDREKEEGPHIFARIVVHIKMLYRLLSSFARKEFCIIIIIFILIVVTHRALHINTTTFHRLMSRAKMSPSSSSSSKKLSQLVSAIKSSDPVRTRALCDDITFDINDAVECDSDGEDDFPLQVALGNRSSSSSSSVFLPKAAHLTQSRRRFLSLPLSFFPHDSSKRRKRKSLTDYDDSSWCVWVFPLTLNMYYMTIAISRDRYAPREEVRGFVRVLLDRL